MAKHPYQALPQFTRWSKSVAALPYPEVDPVVSFPMQIGLSDRVATAGSCFAQHIARYLSQSGFNYFVPETAHELIDAVPEMAKRYNYGTFSARYGNIYTSRQLVQLFKRAHGGFESVEDAWRNQDGAWVDPFRPAIQPSGFATLDELRADRENHLAFVRQMFAELDVFVFTLGLTELWYNKADGTALPVCPGVSGGEFDDSIYGFTNLTANEVIADMTEFFELLKKVNSRAKIILTVSPVPLAATALNRHVLVSTTYSKSVLRVAAEHLCQDFDQVNYYPSYEIITGNFNRGRYYDETLRDVTEEGVSHVMRLFMRHVTGAELDAAPVVTQQQPSDFLARMNDVVHVACEEALIEASLEEEESSSPSA